MNGTYNFFTMITALFLIRFCQSYGAKRVHAVCLGLAAVSLLALANISNKYMTLIPMIGFGICWASMVGVPYLMVASMVPKERSGVYMGILNMMIVIPMLIETVTFGWIFENLLDGKATNAMMLAGGLLGVAGLAMLWVEDPDEAHDSPIMPLATHRHITVYKRVVVGTDGSPASQHAVAHAAGVANAADAHLVVVSAYSPKAGRAGPRQELVRGGGRAICAARLGATAHLRANPADRPADHRRGSGEGLARHRRDRPGKPDCGRQSRPRCRRRSAAGIRPQRRREERGVRRLDCSDVESAREDLGDS